MHGSSIRRLLELRRNPFVALIIVRPMAQQTLLLHRLFELCRCVARLRADIEGVERLVDIVHVLGIIVAQIIEINILLLVLHRRLDFDVSR